MKVVALAGGVGGAKLAQGLAQALSPGDLTVIVNTADDFEHFGLHISPDLDTVCYTLAGIGNPESGWGLAEDTINALTAVEALGGPTWFQLADRDLGTHLERTRRMKDGHPLSRITHAFCLAWGVETTILPMTDDPARTMIQTEEGELSFQEYFVHQRCEPAVRGFRLEGGDSALPAPGVLEALAGADRIVVCPSNPWVSIGPILSIRGIRSAIDPAKAIAVSPIVGGRTIKGPAAKMYAEMSIEPSAVAVAKHYRDVIRHFVMDDEDRALFSEVRELGLQVLVTDTIMTNSTARVRLARSVLDFVGRPSQ